MDFYETVGIKAIGSRLRMLTDKITEDAAGIYDLYAVALQPKWFPVFYALSQDEEKTITGIAQEIGHTHPSVSKIVSEMIHHGVVEERKDATDGRRNMVRLSIKGKTFAKKIEAQYQDVEAAINSINEQATHNLWKALQEWEFLLGQKSLLRRVLEQKKQREGSSIQVVPYEPRFAYAFRSLNEEWISSYFKMEEADYKALDDPEGYILGKGGYIAVALYGGEPVGVCALIKMNDGDHEFELAKMAVASEARGKNIGWVLGRAVLDKARELGAKKIYLESNTILKPAISLYHKLGFQKIAGHPTPYERCNIQMSATLSH